MSLRLTCECPGCKNKWWLELKPLIPEERASLSHYRPGDIIPWSAIPKRLRHCKLSVYRSHWKMEHGMGSGWDPKKGHPQSLRPQRTRMVLPCAASVEETKKYVRLHNNLKGALKQLRQLEGDAMQLQDSLRMAKRRQQNLEMSEKEIKKKMEKARERVERAQWAKARALNKGTQEEEEEEEEWEEEEWEEEEPPPQTRRPCGTAGPSNVPDDSDDTDE